MNNPNPNAQPPAGDSKDGKKDPWEELRGQKDDNGVPQHPEEKADFYKKKANNSTAEAQRIMSQNKDLAQENGMLKTNSQNAQNTVNDMASKVPDWEKLSPQQQQSILTSYGTLQKDLVSVKSQVAKIVDKQEFDNGYNLLVQDESFNRLSEYKDEFISKSYEEENLRTPLKTLAIAFLAEKGVWGLKSKEEKKKPADEGRSGLDSSGAGNQAPPAKKDTYTTAQAKELRETDPRKYNRLLMDKKLNIED